jgi:8-oxo-dGTP diphosphatase
MKEVEVVAAVIQENDKILCLQKGETKYAYTSFNYEFPGGKVNLGETLEIALKREIMEELSMHITIESKLLTHQHSYPDFNITIHFFLCRADNEEPTLSEHINFQWLHKNELSKLDWAAADIPAVQLLAELP